jgi:hypothetical protein
MGCDPSSCCLCLCYKSMSSFSIGGFVAAAHFGQLWIAAKRPYAVHSALPSPPRPGSCSKALHQACPPMYPASACTLDGTSTTATAYFRLPQFHVQVRWKISFLVSPYTRIGCTTAARAHYCAEPTRRIRTHSLSSRPPPPLLDAASGPTPSTAP